MLLNKIFLTALTLTLVNNVAISQEMSQKPVVTLTASRQMLAMPLQFNRGCIEQFHQSNPDIGRATEEISLKAEVKNMGPGPISYEYTATGGSLVGEGPSVKWSLIGSPPGRYTATVEVKNSTGTAIWSSAVVEISTFHCESEWFAFNAEISCATDQVVAGEDPTVTVKVERAPPDAEIGYQWTISAGTIKSGQGTPSISIDIHGLGGANVTATVALTGVPPGIKNQYSCSFSISPHARVSPPEPKARKVDEFGLQINTEEATVILAKCRPTRRRRGTSFPEQEM